MPADTPEIEFILLANAAEVHNGQLYLMGGGWDRLMVRHLQQPIPIGYALSVLVPWSRAGHDLPIHLRLERETGEPVATAAVGNINAQPTPDAPYNRALRCLVTGSNAWPIPEPGAYRLVATVENASRAVLFHIALPNPTLLYRSAKMPTSCQA